MLDYTTDAEAVLYAIRYTLLAINGGTALSSRFIGNSEPVCLLQLIYNLCKNEAL